MFDSLLYCLFETNVLHYRINIVFMCMSHRLLEFVVQKKVFLNASQSHDRMTHPIKDCEN